MALRRTPGQVREHKQLPGRGQGCRLASGRENWPRLQRPLQHRYWRGDHELRIQIATRPATEWGDIVLHTARHVDLFSLYGASVPGERDKLRGNGCNKCVRLVHAAVWSSALVDFPFRRGAAGGRGGVETDSARGAPGDDMVSVRVRGGMGVAARGISTQPFSAGRVRSAVTCSHCVCGWRAHLCILRVN